MKKGAWRWKRAFTRRGGKRGECPNAGAIWPMLAAGLILGLGGCGEADMGRSRPYGPPLYLRGTFFDAKEPKASWAVCDARNELELNERAHYARTLELAAGEYRFKIAGADWNGVNLGGWGKGNEVKFGTPYGMRYARDSLDLKIVIPAAGRYKFALFAENRLQPQLVVEPEDAD
jgi:hypothetical protein